MTEHLGLDALADLLVGEGDDALRAHVDGCPGCRARLAELEATRAPVGAALASLGDPPVPGHLAGRLDAALAQAHQARTAGAGTGVGAGAGAGAAAGAAADVTPLPGPRSHRSRWLPAAGGVAAAAVLVTGGLLLAHRDSGGSSGSDSTAAAPTYRVSSTGTDYDRKGTSLRAALPGLLSGSAARADATLTDTTRSEVAAPTAPTAAGSKASAADPLAGLRSTAGLASCLASLSDPGDPGLPLALDYARFEGKPALAVVLPSSKADKVDVFVVGARCAQADADVLFFTRLPKP